MLQNSVREDVRKDDPHMCNPTCGRAPAPGANVLDDVSSKVPSHLEPQCKHGRLAALLRSEYDTTTLLSRAVVTVQGRNCSGVFLVLEYLFTRKRGNCECIAT